MKKILPVFAAAIFALSSCCCNCEKDTPIPFDDNSGIDVSQFDNVFRNVRLNGTDEIHSIVVLKDGKIIYERYAEGQDPDYLHIMWSASKTFTATAVGFAVQDGLLSVDDKVVKFFDKELPEVISPELDSLTVYDLLIMSSGFENDFISKVEAGVMASPSDSILAQKFKFKPGERFDYNSMNTYLLSAIITKLTGLSCEQYLDEKLFKPLGIRKHLWETSTEGYSMGGWGLHMTTRSLAKAGQFFLQKGQWEGKQLLNPEWFDQAMKVHVSTEDFFTGWIQALNGYGYQMWACTIPGLFRFDGAWGQYSIVMPDKNAVVAVNCHVLYSDVVSEILKEIYPYL